MKTAIKISVIVVYIFIFGYETAHPLFDTVAYWIGPFFTRVTGIGFTLLAGYCAFRLFQQFNPEVDNTDEISDLWEEEETETSSK